MRKCEGCGGELREQSNVRADTGEVFLVCGSCVKRVRRLDADRRPDLSFYHGPIKETRMRFIPSGHSAEVRTLAVDHKAARRGT